MKLISGLAAVALATTTLATTTLAQPATAATEVPPPAAARATTGWLATQLTNGVIHNVPYDFDDLGLTLDIGLSMDEVGGDQAMVRQIRQSMSTRITEYVTGGSFGDPSFRLAGELAKSLVFAEASGADPATYGSYNLVAELENTVTATGPSAGRVVNYSPMAGWSDYANTFSQALAARGLSAAGSPKAIAVTDFLLEQQCDSGYFRVFFNTDPNAAEQGCVEGSDPTDTDATAMVVAQLATISPRPANVDAAITRAVAWLTSTQGTDGSFVGSAFTPDPNSNSTGLAASALAAAGKCVQAGKAAGWVTGLQVGPQAADSPLAGEEGAIAYLPSDLTGAQTNGITDDARGTWWRASVQAVAGLTHLLGSTTGFAATASGSQPGATVTLTGTGATVGDRFCLAGPGISGTRSVAVDSDGTVSAKVTLPQSSGPATYTFTGRDGATSLKVEVGSATALAPVTGVRLTAPRHFQRAGTRVPLEVVGAAAGSRFTLRGPGLTGEVPVVVGPDGVLTRLVTLPAGTGTASYVLTGAGGHVTADVDVLGKATLKITTPKQGVRPGSRFRVVVSRLAAGEKVRVLNRGHLLARGRANDRGRFVARIRIVEGYVTDAKVKAVGQFPALRSGTTRLRALP